MQEDPRFTYRMLAEAYGVVLKAWKATIDAAQKARLMAERERLWRLIEKIRW